MGFLDFLFKRKPSTKEQLLESKRKIEERRIEAKFRLEHATTVFAKDRYEREMAVWEQQLKTVNAALEKI
jgi:hypothetical protein